ncbi:hypothetical protein B0H19DRAFT_1271369 [Mycena capillaripes]|nr:hypothetical protein B0H19DRAFT_1271369 [Mycena capillaripes]
MLTLIPVYVLHLCLPRHGHRLHKPNANQVTERAVYMTIANPNIPCDPYFFFVKLFRLNKCKGVCMLRASETQKPREPDPSAPRAACPTEEEAQRTRFVLDSEPPSQNSSLPWRPAITRLFCRLDLLAYANNNANYDANFVAGDARYEHPTRELLSLNEMLLRECALRITTWVIERDPNFNVAVNFGALLVMYVVVAILTGFQDTKGTTSAHFFNIGAGRTSVYLECALDFRNIVPILLYIEIKIVKTIKAYFISQDVDMYYIGMRTEIFNESLVLPSLIQVYLLISGPALLVCLQHSLLSFPAYRI